MTKSADSKSPTPLRWGILGCARITRRGLAPGILASTKGQLHALASRNEELAQSWAAEFGAARGYGTYEALLADPEVQAVYLPLPNELHKPWVFQAADAGKHVLCEKPLALNAEDAEAMVSHCQARGVVLMEAFMWRHQPRTLEIRQQIASGVLGDLRLIRSSFSFPIEAGDWRLDPGRGGGALWDVGCYGVNTARYFTGSEPTSLRALAHFGTTRVDLTLTAQLAFPNGVIGLIDCSFEQPFRCEYELVGTRGAIQVPHAYLPPARPVALRTLVDTEAPLEWTFEGRDQYAEMVDAFADAVEAGRLSDPAEDGLAQMRVLDAIKAEVFRV